MVVLILRSWRQGGAGGIGATNMQLLEWSAVVQEHAGGGGGGGTYCAGKSFNQGQEVQEVVEARWCKQQEEAGK